MENKIVYKISKKEIAALNKAKEERQKQQQEKSHYKQALSDWFDEFLDENESKMSQKGFRRFLTNIVNKKNVKAVDKAVKYLAKEEGMDLQLLNFSKPFIFEDFSNWAGEYYGDMLMDC